MTRLGFVAVCGAVAVLLGVVFLYTSPSAANVQIVASVLLLGLFVATTVREPGRGLVLVSAAAPFLGVFRRILYQQNQVSFDVLLLVLPAFCLLMLLVISMEYRQQLTTVLRESFTARLLAWLMVVFTLQIFNPAQGGLVVGVAGALFYLAPLAWFFVGRVFLTAEIMQRVLTVFVISSLISACYGLYQTLVGFPSWDQFWITQVTRNGLYNALGAGGTIRAIGPMTSAAEYAAFLAIGLVCLASLIFFRWHVQLLIPAAIMVSALFLESSRTVVLLTACVMLLLLLLRQRHVMTALVVSVLVGVGAVVALLSVGDVVYTATGSSSAAVSGLLAHQINGLVHPLDNRYSTGQLHLQAIIGAFRNMLTSPLGFGLGSTTMSATRFGGTAISAELDIPNAFLSGGLLGGLLYAAIIFRTFRAGFVTAFRYKRLTDVMPVAALAVTVGQILNGGLYSLMPFMWMFIAWIDYRAVEVFGPQLPAKSRRTVAQMLPQQGNATELTG